MRRGDPPLGRGSTSLSLWRLETADHTDRQDADRKGLAQIANETKDLASAPGRQTEARGDSRAARSRSRTSACIGIRDSPRSSTRRMAGILAVGPANSGRSSRTAQLSVATVMTCTLSCDHRVVDGAVGAIPRRLQEARRRSADDAALTRRVRDAEEFIL
jgi:hypothetical protein